MKVQIITRQSVQNYGSFLQCFAAQQVLENLGYEVEIVNYVRQDERLCHIGNTLLKTSNYKDSTAIRKWLFKFLQTINMFISNIYFKYFRSKYFKMGKTRYHSLKKLIENPPIADIYMTGSDQLWGPIGDDKYDRAYFLEYAPKGSKCIAYAASFGTRQIPQELNEEYKNLFSKYKAIGIREDRGVELLNQVGYDKEVKQVLDPTLLLKPQDWEKYMDVTPYEGEDYILAYQVDDIPEMDKYVHEFSERTKMQVIRITPTYYQLLKSGKSKLLPTPSEFLSFIAGAKYFITDSFHGTALSLMYHTNVICVPGNRMNRVKSLLKLTNMNGRILDDYNDFHFIDEEIDFSPADIALETERKKSTEYLKHILTL